jgi:hypothetical protein
MSTLAINVEFRRKRLLLAGVKTLVKRVQCGGELLLVGVPGGS